MKEELFLFLDVIRVALILFTCPTGLLLMDKTLSHFNQYSIDSTLDWEGLRSNRFPKSRLMHPNRDLIKSGFDVPIQGVHSSRKHYQPSHSPEYAFRPRQRQYRDLEHWKPKESNKKIVELQFTQPHPRYQKGHFQEPVYEHIDRSAGIRTFYNNRLKNDLREYSLEDRLQRKVKIDQVSLRQQAFKDQSFRQSQNFPKLKH